MDGSHTISTEKFAGVGIGVYAPAEASRLVGVPAQRFRDWMTGRGNGKALWVSQHATWNDAFIFGFRDLMEARIVFALRRHGFSLQELRGTMNFAAERIGDARPFSTKDFKIAGKDILLDLPEGIVTVSRRDRGQSVFREVVAPILKSVEYSDTAARFYWPQRRKRTVVIDPERAFGKPILADYGVPTDVIARSVKAEGSEKSAARYFDIPIPQVRDAVAFEENPTE